MSVVRANQLGLVPSDTESDDSSEDSQSTCHRSASLQLYADKLIEYFRVVRTYLYASGITDIDLAFPIREMTPADDLSSAHTCFGLCHKSEHSPLLNGRGDRQVFEHNRTDYIALKLENELQSGQFHRPASLLSTFLHELAHAMTPASLVFVDDERQCLVTRSGKGRDPKGSKGTQAGNSGKGRRGGQRGRHKDALKDKSGISRFFPHHRSQEEKESKPRRNVWVQEAHSIEFYHNYARILRVAVADGILGLGGKTANMFSQRSLERFDRLDDYAYPMPLSQAGDLHEAWTRVQKASDSKAESREDSSILHFIRYVKDDNYMHVNDTVKDEAHSRLALRAAAHNAALAYALHVGEVRSEPSAIVLSDAVFLHDMLSSPSPTHEAESSSSLSSTSRPSTAVSDPSDATPPPEEKQLMPSAVPKSLRVTLRLAVGKNRGRERMVLLGEEDRSVATLAARARAKMRIPKKLGVILRRDDCLLTDEDLASFAFESLVVLVNFE